MKNRSGVGVVSGHHELVDLVYEFKLKRVTGTQFLCVLGR